LGEEFVKGKYRQAGGRLFKKYKVIFIHIPKAGGTSVATKLYGKRAGHSTAAQFQGALGKDVFNSLFSFSVVRNPYDRIVSAYHFARQGGGSEGSIRHVPVYQSETFSTFERFVKEWLIHQNPHTTELVFRPQYLFVCDNQLNILLDWIGRIENTAEIEAIISQKTGRTISIEKRNTSKRKGVQEYYTPELKELVYKYYQHDFELFGYER
jgi:hypothetical protein